MKFTIPTPPSTNSLYANIPGRGRVPSGQYQRWKDAADGALWGVKITRFTVPVEITLVVADKGRRDLDNFAKAVLDFMVRHEIIADDSRKYLRKLTLQFGDVENCLVEVKPA